MPVSSLSARHRAAGRTATALSSFADCAAGTLAAVGRRSGVVIAASGLIMSVVAAPASAAPSTIAPAAASAVDTSTLTAAARTALDGSPVVSVPADTVWVLDDPVVNIVADPSPPTTRPHTSKAASRSAARTAPPASATVVAIAVTAAAAIPQSVASSAVLGIAARYVGVPYVWGGTTPNGFDCSGFTQYVYAQLGVALPRTAEAQRGVGPVVSRADALPGDLISSPGHVAIYAGGNQEIDAPRPGESIRFRAIWQSTPVFIRVS